MLKGTGKRINCSCLFSGTLCGLSGHSSLYIPGSLDYSICMKNPTKLKFFLLLLLTLTGIHRILAIEFTISPPVFEGLGADLLNSALAGIFKGIENEINRDLIGIDVSPSKMTGAFADSSVYSSAGATQRTYSGYKSFAFTLGGMVGAQIPGSPFSLASDLDGMLDKLEREGDIQLGFNPQVLNAQFGINTSKFFLNDFYLGFKLGFMRMNIKDVSIKTFSIGVLGNYQLLKHRSLAAGLFLWGGLNIGTGFVYQNSTFGMGFPLDPLSESYSILGNRISINVEPKLYLDFKVHSYAIPLEAMSSIRLFGLLNIPFGLGADIAFGSAGLTANGTADISFGGLPNFWRQSQPAAASAVMGEDKSPTVVNPKIMTGLGINIGPFTLDFPVTIFFLNKGYNVGVNLGFVI